MLCATSLIAVAPAWFGPRWFFIDAIGIVGTLAILRWVVEPGARFPLRTLAAFLLLLCVRLDLGELSRRLWAARADGVLADAVPVRLRARGLWFGPAFSAIGLGLTALILAGYVWSGAAFPLWLAVVYGGGFILCGLWMRRA